MHAHAFVLLLVTACASTPTKNGSPATIDDATYITGTWTTSTTSYADASTATTGVKIGRDGSLYNGTFEGGKLAIVAAGPSPGFVAHVDVDPKTHAIHFALDGAEESARYTLEPPDRWKTETTSGDAVTVYYVRRIER